MKKFDLLKLIFSKKLFFFKKFSIFKNEKYLENFLKKWKIQKTKILVKNQFKKYFKVSKEMFE